MTEPTTESRISRLLEALAKLGQTTAEITSPKANELRVKLGSRVAKVFVKPASITITIAGSRQTLPSSSSASAVAKAIVKSLSGHQVGYRDVAGRQLYLVRHESHDRPNTLVLATSAQSAARVAGDHFKLVPHRFSAEVATEDEEGRHDVVLLENGTRVHMKDVVSAMSAIR